MSGFEVVDGPADNAKVENGVVDESQLVVVVKEVAVVVVHIVPA